MKSLSQFKAEEKVSHIDLLQGKGRKYATVNDKSLIVSKDCDMSKPLFVIATTNKDSGLVIPNLYTLINAANVQMVGSI
jgi:hypothetical protein